MRKRLHVIVAHFASKSGSGTALGRFQPAENGAVRARIQQAELVGRFVETLEKADSQAKVSDILAAASQDITNYVALVPSDRPAW